MSFAGRCRSALVFIVAGLFACHHADEEPDFTADVQDFAQADEDVDEGRTGIDPNGGGGSVRLLSFTVLGDARPPVPDDNAGYPTKVLTGIFDGMAAQSPQFAVGTGDYMYVALQQSAATAQVASFKQAQAGFFPPVFLAMGNHECNSLSDINCPKLTESVNITTYLKELVPFTKGVPWFDFTVHTSLGDAKFLFIAANAWNDDQAAWLTKALVPKTPYTFVMRHQPTPNAGHPSSAAGIAGSNTLLAGYPVTLFLYGHVHEYLHLTTNAAIAGNAGAPLDAGEYGWLKVDQRADGTVAVTAYSEATGMPVDTWAVTSDGQKAP